MFDNLAQYETLFRWLRYIARGVLLIVTGFWFIFALLSGSEAYGGGIRGVVLNAPNALPWTLLLLFNVLVWKWELAGGVLIMLLGLVFSFFFDLWETNWGGLLIIFMPLELLGLIFVACSWFDHRYGIETG